MLKYSISSKEINRVFTITRSPLKSNQDGNPKVVSYQEKDNSKWCNIVKVDIKEPIDTLLTGLATTRSVGGTDFQYKIDHDLNLDLAKAAKEKGCKTLVLVSSLGAKKDSRSFYPKRKGEIERDMIALKFDKTVILRLGSILSDRIKHNIGFSNDIGTFIGKWLYRSRIQWMFGYPVMAEEEE